ncbi:MAG: hypothetical protein MK010_04300 [Erythrobacter sp.]|nr:hypothetical protein [Erythrobacter sp.]
MKVTSGGDQGIHSLSLNENANQAESMQAAASANKTSARFFQRSSVSSRRIDKASALPSEDSIFDIFDTIDLSRGSSLGKPATYLRFTKS